LELAAPALGFFGCIIPYSSLSELQTKWKIMVVGLFSAAVNIASLSAIVLALTGMLDEAITVSLFAFVACMLYSWVPGFLADK
jgi:hypothetical protein